MRLYTFALTGAVLVSASVEFRRRAELPVARPNDNTHPAGMLREGILTLDLEARRTRWNPDGDSLPGLDVEAFAEVGHAPSAPGPLVRVPVGTEMRFRVRNTLAADTLTFHVPSRIAALAAARGSAAPGTDSLVLAPGASGELRIRATRPGSYLYHANGRTALDRVLRLRGLLAGAIIVDPAGAPPPRDRVLVLLDVVDSLNTYDVPLTRREVMAVNGRSWPHTERLTHTVGDTVRWRVLNASPAVHPMHLHGFYFRVDEFDGAPAAVQASLIPGRMAVTERMAPFTSMQLTWVPERAGNWLFHCHFQAHAAPHRPLGMISSQTMTKHEDHARTGMGGLVMGVLVRPRPGERSLPVTSRTGAAGTGTGVTPDAPRRALRLVAVRDSGFPDSLPSLHFRLEERATGRQATAHPGFSPTIELARGEPVSISVVNQLGEALSVHWHGIELESYFDGVAGFSGSRSRLAPLIALRDSFEARFTPPRSGTFIYHSHVDEVRQHRAGLVGALIVRDAPIGSAPIDEHLFFIKSARGSVDAFPMEINGDVDPDTLVLQVGRPYRFRFISLSVTSPNATVFLTARPDSSLANLRDTMLVRWRPLAKDGADLPESQRTLQPATQVVAIGETHDVEFVPLRRGALRLEVRPPSLGRLTVRVPIRVE
ncbi:MAG: multicopper oxidase domain-containing protein [Gemmatimonadaceae bacterium]|nr:multicopper oxidase domain-containing protein [Gemmatimonadaceae bacterium]